MAATECVKLRGQPDSYAMHRGTLYMMYLQSMERPRLYCFTDGIQIANVDKGRGKA